MMIAEVADKQKEIAALCERYEVIRLGLFGSAARGDFKPESSDLDFLVLFDRRAEPDYVMRYLDLADELEALFNREVDLVTEYQVQSDHFKREIDRDLEPLYVRASVETAA